MKRTNVEFAEKLEELAIKYRENEALPQPMLFHSIASKEAAATIIRGLGGKWTKKTSPDTSEYSSITLTSEKFGTIISMPRDLVCKRTVVYDCTPLLSPEEEAELLVEV
jgi:hypothetical protein